jgi:hypothetical protein
MLPSGPLKLRGPYLVFSYPEITRLQLQKRGTNIKPAAASPLCHPRGRRANIERWGQSVPEYRTAPDVPNSSGLTQRSEVLSAPTASASPQWRTFRTPGNRVRRRHASSQALVDCQQTLPGFPFADRNQPSQTPRRNFHPPAQKKQKWTGKRRLARPPWRSGLGPRAWSKRTGSVPC